MQQLWAFDFGWDEALPPERIKTWIQWISELQHLEKIKVQRCLRAKSDRTQVRATLHIFADASSVAYAACAYLVTEYDSGQPTSILVAARARLRKRGLTIPRCELEGAVLASGDVSKTRPAFHLGSNTFLPGLQQCPLLAPTEETAAHVRPQPDSQDPHADQGIAMALRAHGGQSRGFALPWDTTWHSWQTLICGGTGRHFS